ncbi:MAG: hypothetical protein GW893_17095 [Armatimonadetes bacterium]|nr:hypothetical protein [Armatimonadota bacterium]
MDDRLITVDEPLKSAARAAGKTLAAVQSAVSLPIRAARPPAIGYFRREISA